MENNIAAGDMIKTQVGGTYKVISIDRYKNVPSKTITNEYDGEIMFRHKQKNNEK